MSRTLMLAAAMLVAAPALAKDGFTFGAGAEAAYDSNVFRLASDKLDKPGTDTESDDKYYGMESASDTIIGLCGRVEWERGKTVFRVQPGASVYQLNPKRTHGSLDLKVMHGAWKGGEVFLDVGLVPSRFKKNYLVDADADGSSKVYDAGVSTEVGARVGAKSRLSRNLDGDAWLGGGAEVFDAPFANRDRRVFDFGAGLELELGEYVRTGLSYRGALVQTDDGDEVVVEGSSASPESVNRSNSSHEVTPEITLVMSKRVRVRAAYEALTRSYSSDGASDPYRDRTDSRHTASADVRFELGKNVRLGVGVLASRAITDRPNYADAQADEVDYERQLAWVGISASF